MQCFLHFGSFKSESFEENKTTLGSLISHKKGFAFKSKDYIEKGIPVIRVSNFSGDTISSDDVKFVVNESGDISNVEILKGVPGCNDCDKEAIRVVKSMPKWKPAKMTGRAVKCYFNLPFSFKIQ